jgi:hypothetical protein
MGLSKGEKNLVLAGPGPFMLFIFYSLKTCTAESTNGYSILLNFKFVSTAQNTAYFLHENLTQISNLEIIYSSHKIRWGRKDVQLCL